MRILWLSHFVPYPPKGGHLQRGYHLLREASARHEVALVAFYQRSMFDGAASLREATDHLDALVQSVTVVPIPSDAARWRWWTLLATTYFRTAPYDVTLFESREMEGRLREIAGSGSTDLLHLDTVGLWPFAEMFPGTPVVLNHHNVESQMMSRRAGKEQHPLRRHYLSREATKLRRLEERAATRAAVNLVVSPLDAERLRAVAPGSRIEVVDNGVDVEYFRPSPDAAPEPDSLIFVGAMYWYPNREAVEYLVDEIWPLVSAARPSRTLTIVGRKPPPAVAAIEDRRVRVTDFVPDVRPYLEAAEIYVCPIRSGGGTRLKILDALAMEKPVVATRVAVEGLAMVEGEHFIPAESPSEFAAAIDRLSRDPELRRDLGLAGRKLVEERYAWPVVGRALERAYVGAASRRAPSA
ncbi:MAG: glycosyltransferase family 4 protein [Gemmatimonadales bacterium]